MNEISLVVEVLIIFTALVDACLGAGFNLAGTQYSQECWCGNALNVTALVSLVIWRAKERYAHGNAGCQTVRDNKYWLVGVQVQDPNLTKTNHNLSFQRLPMLW